MTKEDLPNWNQWSRKTCVCVCVCGCEGGGPTYTRTSYALSASSKGLNKNCTHDLCSPHDRVSTSGSFPCVYINCIHFGRDRMQIDGRGGDEGDTGSPFGVGGPPKPNLFFGGGGEGRK